MIKSAKAAVNHIVSIPPYSSLGDHPSMIKFMKGVFNLRPPKQKHGFIWDAKILFYSWDCHTTPSIQTKIWEVFAGGHLYYATDEDYRNYNQASHGKCSLNCLFPKT